MATIQTRDIVIDIEETTGDDYLLVGIRPNNVYQEVDGKNVLKKDAAGNNVNNGYKYEVVLPKRMFKSIVVKVEAQIEPLASAEEIENLGGIKVNFTGLEMMPYSNNGQIAISCKAEKITRVSTGK
ncbi:hypothetical protein P0E39_10445 [Enterococcus faecalis]|uniref:hypothetical protein n=1 Tax=Enterococcus faecalis TaxID=1351 RepID=UPI0025B08D50|nr:hypothetical protein [Enterococcus faecalis]MDN3095143.1 hypothetical protein [Enterococcus faecalis]